MPGSAGPPTLACCSDPHAPTRRNGQTVHPIPGDRMMLGKQLLLAAAISIALGVCAATPATAASASPATGSSQPEVDKATRLTALYDQYWEEMLRLNPLQATFQGD